MQPEILIPGKSPIHIVLAADPVTEKVAICGGLFFKISREEVLASVQQALDEKGSFGPYYCFNAAALNFPEMLHEWLLECKIPRSEAKHVLKEIADYLMGLIHDRRPASVRTTERRQLEARRREREQKRKEKQKRKKR